MVIDVHTHITRTGFPEILAHNGREAFSARTLLRHMDRQGIDKSVVLPIDNPENAELFAITGTRETIKACRKHADRLVPFCNVDPRAMLDTPKADLSKPLRMYKEMGCRGVGEMCAHLPITDPRYDNLFHHAGELGLPVLMHVSARRRGEYGVYDRLHLPGLERALQRHPKTIFIGHAPTFWSEIDGAVTNRSRGGYPSGPVRSEGRLWRLFAVYPNLYADVSAGSGYNALSRDPELGLRFLRKFNRKLLFGTDRFTSPREPTPPILLLLREALRDGKLTRPASENIMHRNATRILGKM